mgnify:CR=1 FL=1
MVLDERDFAYYYTLRTEARKRVVDALNRRIKTPEHRAVWRGITLGSIDSEALKQARTEWPKFYGPNSHLGFDESWERLYYKFAATQSFFDLAIWQEYDGNKILQGMALGKPSKGKTHLTLHWIERSYAPTYFKGGILLPTLATAEEYAKLLGSERVLIKDPVDPTPFQQYGYAPFSGAIGGPARVRWLSKELNYG